MYKIKIKYLLKLLISLNKSNFYKKFMENVAFSSDKKVPCIT